MFQNSIRTTGSLSSWARKNSSVSTHRLDPVHCLAVQLPAVLRQALVAAHRFIVQFAHGGEVAPDLQPFGLVRGDFEAFGLIQ